MPSEGCWVGNKFLFSNMNYIHKLNWETKNRVICLKIFEEFCQNPMAKLAILTKFRWLLGIGILKPSVCFERFGRYLHHVVDLKLKTASSSDTKTVDVQWHCQWRRRKMKNSSPSNSFFDFLVVKTRVTNPSYDKPLSMAAAGNMYKYQKRWVCPSATCSCTIICALSSFWNPKGCEFESKRTKVLNLDLPWCESIFDPGHMKSMGKG